MKPVNIGLLGLGTVGGGAAAVLRDNAEEISRRLGREIRISAMCDLSEEKARQICPSAAFVKDPFELVARKDVDVVVELFGGTGIAKEAVLKAIENGKHIVTANKKLLAEYGNEIFPLAEKQNVIVQFEAAVAGGIPIIKALREGLAANRIKSIAGIINGTSNFILSEMREKGSAFADVLKEAQALGYAEADPTFDIEGNDAGHKITIMSALAFGTPMNFSACYLEGISKLDSRDIKYA
ncbi:homoserine dehydrogenase, partial [Neisseria gonorrhoeae]